MAGEGLSRRVMRQTKSSIAIKMDSDSDNKAPFVGNGDGAPEAQHVHLDQVNMPEGGNQPRCHPFDLNLAAPEEEEEEEDLHPGTEISLRFAVGEAVAAEGLSRRVTRRTASSIAIQNDSNRDSDDDTWDALPVFPVGPDDENFKGLVKERRFDCFHRLGASAGITAALASSTEYGILDDNRHVQHRQEAFGVNTYPKRKTKSLCSHFSDALRDIFLLVLLVCAALSIGFGIKEHGVKDGWYDGVGMLVSVFLIATMSAVGNHCHGKLFDPPCRYSDPDNNPVTVLRGELQDVPTSDVVVGDIVALGIDDIVPADGVVIEGHDLKIKKSMKLRPVVLDKTHEPFCPAGAKVTNGWGRIVVTAVGKDTDCGEWMSRNTKPTLQMRLDDLKSKISKVRNALAVIIALFSTSDTGDGKTSKVAGMFQHSLTIIVSAIPEALPLAVSLTLAFCMKRMLKERVLVQRFSDCEKFGSVTTVLTKKPRLPVPNEMTVTQFWIDTNPVKDPRNIPREVLDFICQLIWTNQGLRSDVRVALRSWTLTELGMDSDHFKMTCKTLAVGHGTDMDSSVTSDSARGAVFHHRAGAADRILAGCCRYVKADGERHELGVEKTRQFQKIISDIKEESLCIVYALAFRQVNNKQEWFEMGGLTLLCLVGLKVSCHPGDKDAIEACVTAGISVKMLIQHGEDTAIAEAVLRECGVISRDDTDGMVHGGNFFIMSPDQQLEMVDRIRVMFLSLIKRQDKMLLLQRLKEKGHVVADTCGDTDESPWVDFDLEGPSSNDSEGPSSKNVHLFADAVINNDGLDKVARAACWGRCVYANIQKFIQFHLTFNIAAVVVNLVSAVSKGKVLLTSVQLLWVSLIIDTMGVLALATDTPPIKVLMRRPPVNRTEPLISNAMWRDITAQAVFQVAVLLAIAYGGRHFFDTSVNAMIFNAFVLCQVFNEFNARQMEQKNIFAGLHRNWMFLAIVAVTLALQVLMVEVLATFVGTQRLSWVQWGVCGVIAVMSWPIALVVKFIPVPDKPFHEFLPKFTFRFFSR